MKRTLIISLVTFGIFVILITSIKGEIIIVDDDDDGKWTDYTSIQDAINASTNNDTIQLNAGLYDGNLFINKSINIIGNGSTKTLITDTVGLNINDSVSRSIIIIAASRVNLSNFEIIGGHRTYHVGIDCDYPIGPISSISIIGITFRNCTQPVEIDEVNHCRIFNCTFINYTNIALKFDGDGNDSLVKRCSFINNHNYSKPLITPSNSTRSYYPHNWSIVITGITNTTIKNCIIISNQHSSNVGGIWIKRTTNLSILSCIIINHTYFGIFLDKSSTSSLIHQCTFINNTGLAIQANTSNHSIYNNAFYNIESYSQVFDDQYNSWDNGIIGNFWSDYNGTDANTDDIGDTPYVINANLNITDRYPLLKDPTIKPPKSISLSIIPDSDTPLSGQHITIYCIINSSSYFPYAIISFYVDGELITSSPIIIHEWETYWEFQWTASQGNHHIVVLIEEPINTSDEIQISVIKKSKSSTNGFQISTLMIISLSLFITELSRQQYGNYRNNREKR